MINLNVSPYYDDFYKDSPNGNGFSQILFKPGVTVQARELIQIQTILRDQIAKFGSHVFKHGSVVLPGNSTSDLSVGYVKLTGATDITYLTGQYVTNLVTGLKAYVKQVVNSTLTDPRTLIVSYVNSGSDGSVVFPAGATLTPSTGATVDVGVTTPTGGAALASVNRGVFFVNGTFVGVEPQTIVISKYSSTPNCHVLLQVVEEIIGADTDLSLLDPSQGTGNYAAPGADRIKISLVLTTLPYGTVFDSNYIELMRFNSGVLEEHLRYAQYSELEKNLARRTYDESGDYVVSGLKTTIIEDFKTSTNGGRSLSGDPLKFVNQISPGKAYIKGFEKETTSVTNIVVDKPRTSQTIIANAVARYGQFLYISGLTGLPDFLTKPQITLKNSAGTTVGTANTVAIDFHMAGTDVAHNIYKLYFSDMSALSSGTLADIASASFTDNTASATKTFLVCSKISLSSTGSAPFVVDNSISDVTTARQSTIRAISSVTSGEIYAFASSSLPSVLIGDVVNNGTTKIGKVNSIETIGRNAYDNLLMVLPNGYTKTINNTSYKVFQEFNVTGIGGALTIDITVSGGQSFDTPTINNIVGIAYVSGTATILPSTAFALFSANTIRVTFSPVSGVTTCKVIAEVNVPAGYTSSVKTKTKQNQTDSNIAISSGKYPLTKSDGIRLISVLDLGASSADVTSKFKFDGGQRDYAYTNAFITLKDGETVSGNVTVNYDYFTHGTGDYFSVDSYPSATYTDLVTGRATKYYDTDLMLYKSQGSGKNFDLRNCLDFRPRTADSSTVFTGGTAITSRIPVLESIVTASIDQYLGRIDAVVLDKDGVIKNVLGTASLEPKVPLISSESIHLATVYVPPYVFNVADINVVTQTNKGYTMKDVGKLEKRISNLEDYALLSQSEANVVNYDVVDARSGLSRFKSGYLVDTFNDADKIGDVFNKQFTVTYYSGSIIPQFEVIEATLVQSGTNNLTSTNGQLLTLPFTEVVMAQQPLSSGVVNVNPFSVFSYKGNMTITPATDTWTDMQSLPAIIQDTVENVVVTRSWGQPGWAGITIQPAPTPVWVWSSPGGQSRGDGVGGSNGFGSGGS